MSAAPTYAETYGAPGICASAMRELDNIEAQRDFERRHGVPEQYLTSANDYVVSSVFHEARASELFDECNNEGKSKKEAEEDLATEQEEHKATKTSLEQARAELDTANEERQAIASKHDALLETNATLRDLCAEANKEVKRLTVRIAELEKTPRVRRAKEEGAYTTLKLKHDALLVLHNATAAELAETQGLLADAQEARGGVAEKPKKKSPRGEPDAAYQALYEKHMALLRTVEADDTEALRTRNVELRDEVEALRRAAKVKPEKVAREPKKKAPRFDLRNVDVRQDVIPGAT